MRSLAQFVPDAEMVLRLSLASLGGLLLGLDREIRGRAAGIRTHALVSLSAAVTTVSALMLYDEFAARGRGGDTDPLRVIQGLAQAIGFIAAGTIITARGNVHNLTSAANLWLAAALGIAAGAGQFALALMALAFGIVILTVIRVIEPCIPGSEKARHGVHHEPGGASSAAVGETPSRAPQPSQRSNPPDA